MKFLIVLALVFACVAARPQNSAFTTVATIVKDEMNLKADGSYNYAFETSDGVKHDEEASLKAVGTDTVLNVMGSYSYTAPDGQIITVHYIADENGFQPDNVPKA